MMIKNLLLIHITAVLLVIINPISMLAGNMFAADSTGKVGSFFILDVNNFKLPINNIGMTAVTNNNNYYGELAGERVLFSGGFSLTGKMNNEIWLSNVLYASLVRDYLPGIANDITDLSKELYVVRKSDPPFGKSWQDWKDAVKSGALFYDGDFDGVYNPVDKNLNGIWDTNEDMPYLLGDITVWSVYNDSEQNRRIQNTYPMGIEIQQTAFASSESHLQNTIFIMYSIINRGLISDSLNNVYFSIWADPDIGHHEDDLVASDTTIASSYTFNGGIDSEIGDDPPALFFTFLQGPKVIDTTMGGFQFQAINNFGFYYGVYVYEGYRNLKPSSFQNNIPFQQPLWWDETKSTLYNRILGLRPEGIPVDPCNFDQGFVIPYSLCDKVNPLFLFSGDPVNNYGWINTVQRDQRILFNIGPFNLFINEPQHIIIAYTGGKGVNALNSVTVGKELVQGVIQEYKNNFPSLTYKSGEPYFQVTEYRLYQNFPNPFNPSTVISWQAPAGSWQTLKVYDVLGREVATLVDEFREAGYHEVEFQSAVGNRQLASGVYFYQLRARGPETSSGQRIVETKKMILLR